MPVLGLLGDCVLETHHFAYKWIQVLAIGLRLVLCTRVPTDVVWGHSGSKPRRFRSGIKHPWDDTLSPLHDVTKRGSAKGQTLWRSREPLWFCVRFLVSGPITTRPQPKVIIFGGRKEGPQGRKGSVTPLRCVNVRPESALNTYFIVIWLKSISTHTPIQTKQRGTSHKQFFRHVYLSWHPTAILNFSLKDYVSRPQEWPPRWWPSS